MVTGHGLILTHQQKIVWNKHMYPELNISHPTRKFRRNRKGHPRRRPGQTEIRHQENNIRKGEAEMGSIKSSCSWGGATAGGLKKEVVVAEPSMKMSSRPRDCRDEVAVKWLTHSNGK
jgi:hypothetical protein